MSQPTVSKAKTSYPLYSATWANSKPSCLIVGGGGGAGRHGVKNKVSVFDFADRAPNVEPCAEIDASEHDSVTCLANLGTKDGCVLLAGINDSEEDRLAGKNECLKGFEVRFPKKADGKGEISFLSKTALFTPPTSTGAKKEGYQRVVRLSPVPRTALAAPTKRIGAVASSLAGDENEIVVFSATSNKPDNPQDVIQRIALHKGQEANDLDILDQGDGKFQVAYCLDNDVYVQKVHYDFTKRKSLGKADADRTHAYSIPLPDVDVKKGRSKIRCIRWLSPSHILLLTNKPNRTGAELQVLRLYEQGKPGSIILRKKFAGHVQAAVDMDVALLSADEDGAYQAVVAVAAIDVSLSVLTINYRGENLNTISRFSSFATYYNVSIQSPYSRALRVHDRQSKTC
jgi:prolactin regulatory element-binding protein